MRLVTEDRRQGAELSVTSTPTFFFAEVREDGRLSLLAKLSGALPYSTFQTTLDELLSATESRVAEGSLKRHSRGYPQARFSPGLSSGLRYLLYRDDRGPRLPPNV